MKAIRFKLISSAMVCFFVLTAAGCWEFVLERRVCPIVTMIVPFEDVTVGEGEDAVTVRTAEPVTIPDCLGIVPLQTVLHRETVEAVGLDESLLSLETILGRNPLATFQVTAGEGAIGGSITSFILDFDPIGRGRRARPFDQELEVLVLFEGHGDPPVKPKPTGCSAVPVQRDQACAPSLPQSPTGCNDAIRSCLKSRPNAWLPSRSAPIPIVH